MRELRRKIKVSTVNITRVTEVAVSLSPMMKTTELSLTIYQTPLTLTSISIIRMQAHY